MTTPDDRSPRAVGAAAVTALAIAIVLMLLPLLRTVPTLLGPVPEARYVGQILLTELPFIVFAPLAAAIIAFVGFAGPAPVRGSLRMAQVVGRGFATAVIALLVAALVAAVGSAVAVFAGIGGHSLSMGTGSLLGLLGRMAFSTGLGQLGGKLEVLVVVPLGALLLWGWLRRPRSQPQAAADSPPFTPQV